MKRTCVVGASGTSDQADIIGNTVTAVEHVRELHLPTPGPGIHLKQCNTCRDQNWPCPTIRSLNQQLGET